MKLFTSFIGLFLCLNAGPLKESDHLPAEIWQRADGSYCIKVLNFNEVNHPNNHIYVIHGIIVHSEECCDGIDPYTFYDAHTYY